MLSRTFDELRLLRNSGPPSAYRAALHIAAPGILEALLERHDKLDAAPSEQLCELVADWLWLRILGWCQRNNVPDSQREDLFKLVEAIRTAVPLEASALAPS
ncbi:hypothetical protein BVH03_17835 [Pseudomonas sp. PA15(2017)]|nr:hypothetical protein BVH03_17835 [Pseudomonas sp. PA15(2017)]